MTAKTSPKKELTADELLKLEVAEELGLLEKVKRTGWGSLTAKETGRIGGIITSRKRIEKLKQNRQEEPSE
jgi:small acid-soluble spore protein F (minor alpha/beta-type SASP)